MNFKIISFYKYVKIEEPEFFIEPVRNFCNKFNLLGRILIGKEGINGNLCGKKEDILRFKKWLTNKDIFYDVDFREQSCKYFVHHKLAVKFKDEIVAFGQNVNLNNKGKHISPREFKELMDKKYKEGNDNFVVLDARNIYEAEVGKFKDALVLPIMNFRDFPKFVNELEKHKKEKIVMYCTGGVRCEKASAYLKENGFENVFQLEGGIINYLNEYPNDYFEGSCFVFDDRLVTNYSETNLFCFHCSRKSNIMINCHNLDCDKLFVGCENCIEVMNRTCSEECRNAPRHRKKACVIYN